MGRDNYNVDTGIREIMASLRSEARCRELSTERARISRSMRRAHYLRQVELGISAQLRKPLISIDGLLTYIENYRRYPEVRKYAAEILYRAYPDTENISRRRQQVIHQLNSVIREFRHE